MNVRKIFKRNSLVYYILKTLIAVIIFCNCSQGKLRSPNTADKILSLKKGDRILIELTDNTQLEGVFIKREKWEIVIHILDNNIVKQESVKIDSISKIQKQVEKKSGNPKTWITIIMISVFVGLLYWASYLSGIGQLGS